MHVTSLIPLALQQMTVDCELLKPFYSATNILTKINQHSFFDNFLMDFRRFRVVFAFMAIAFCSFHMKQCFLVSHFRADSKHRYSAS